ncbi:MAG: hypothetical protein P1V20_11275 [Verrucomicrobiales bacterium]|nr:hypothetical protein [Verrucomicrobiales bacterium]
MAETSYTSHFFASDGEAFNRHHTESTSSAADLNRLGGGAARGLLVGALDCRRLGTQLRPHIFSRLFNLESYRCAGLVSKDLSKIGGHNVLNFGEAALEMEAKGANVIHLGCDSTVTGLVSGYHRASEGDEENRLMSLMQVTARNEMENYIKRRSGQTSPLAYVLAPNGCYKGSNLSFFGLRLPEPSVLEEDQEEHLTYCAGEATFVGVSGKNAEDFLTDRGVACEQMPCGLSVLPRLCGKPLSKVKKKSAAYSRLKERFGKGWIAVEISDIPERQEIDFANAVSALAVSKGLGIAVYSSRSIGRDAVGRQLKWEALLGETAEVMWFGDSDIWEIAYMIGNAKFYVGSCLDSRIIAGAFCVPRINTPRADRRNVDYCSVWEAESIQDVLGEDQSAWVSEMNRAMEVSPSTLQRHAEATAEAFFSSISIACRQTTLTTRLFAGEKPDHFGAVLHGQKIASDWMKTPEDRSRFSKLNKSNRSGEAAPSVRDEVKKVVKKFTK